MGNDKEKQEAKERAREKAERQREKEELKRRQKQDRTIDLPTATQAAEMDDQERLIIRGLALFCASNFYSRDVMSVPKQAVVAATKFEYYLLYGTWPGDEEQDD